MVLDPTKEFSPTQKEIIKVFPAIECLIAEQEGGDSTRLSDYKKFLTDLKKEYKWLESRARTCYMESTGEEVHTYIIKLSGIQRGINDKKILFWYSKFKKYYVQKPDERINIILGFLKFKHVALIRAKYGNNWLKSLEPTPLTL